MKRLLLLRHAKSDWSDPLLEDFDRPLASRGRVAAPRMGRYLASKIGAPDLVLCSDALRTRQTWSLVAAELAETAPARPVKFLRGLYLARPSRLLSSIRRAPDDVGSLLLVGHNPGMHDLACALVGDGKAKALGRLAGKFPTAALAEIHFDLAQWRALEPGTGRLKRFVRPKDLA